LTNERRPDLVALLMNQTTFPSWGFLLTERQVTSWPETWSGWGSQIIQVVGTPGAWFYEGLAGIRPDPEQPGFKHFVIRPGIVDAVDWVKCRHRSPYGDIVSNWKRTGGKLELEVSVPPNTTATVAVPITGAGTVTESGKDIAAAETIRLLRREAGQTLYELQPGRYVLQSTISP
jgi:alpha-L-rhamnosidase